MRQALLQLLCDSGDGVALFLEVQLGWFGKRPMRGMGRCLSGSFPAPDQRLPEQLSRSRGRG